MEGTKPGLPDSVAWLLQGRHHLSHIPAWSNASTRRPTERHEGMAHSIMPASEGQLERETQTGYGTQTMTKPPACPANQPLLGYSLPI